MTTPTRQSKIAALVLAAGTSSRFGATKLAVALNGTALVRHALLAARDVCPGNVHLVVGHQRHVIEAAASELFDRAIINRNYADGIGTSIAAGISACSDDFDAVLLMLSDQVLISSEHLHALVQCWHESGVEIVASSYEKTVGPPILFSRSTFAELVRLRGDNGAKRIVDSGKFSVRTLHCPAAAIDIDTPEDLDAITQR